MKRHLPLISILFMAVVVSGCTSLPEIQTNTDTLHIGEDDPAELEVWVKNNYDDPSNFELSVSSPEILTIQEGTTGEQNTQFDLGEAASNSETNKQTLLISGNVDQLDEQQTQGTFHIDLSIESDPQNPDQEPITETVTAVISR